MSFDRTVRYSNQHAQQSHKCEGTRKKKLIMERLNRNLCINSEGGRLLVFGNVTLCFHGTKISQLKFHISFLFRKYDCTRGVIYFYKSFGYISLCEY